MADEPNNSNPGDAPQAGSEQIHPTGQPQGVLGDGAAHPGKYNMRLAERAIRNDWPIGPQTRRLIVDQMAITATQSDQERNRIAASRVLVAADSVNVKREALDLQADQHANPAAVSHVHSGIIGLAPIRHELLTDPKYLEFARSREIESDVDTGAVRQDGESGPARTVETDTAPGTD